MSQTQNLCALTFLLEVEQTRIAFLLLELTDSPLPVIPPQLTPAHVCGFLERFGNHTGKTIFVPYITKKESSTEVLCIVYCVLS